MTFDVTQRFQAEQGWTDSTLLGLLLEYVSNQKADSTLEEFLQAKADFENEATKGLLGFTPQGNCRLPLPAKLEGFSHCVLDGSWEDALGHLFDFLHYLCPKLTIRVTESGPDNVKVHATQILPYGTPAYFGVLHQSYGQNPMQLRGSHVKEEGQTGP
jgi:hypothetical protein